MDDRIVSGRDVQKLFARSGGFSAQEMGVLGVVARHGIEYFYAPTRRHTMTSEFDIRELTSLPRVDIQYSYAGGDGGAKTDAKAVIVVTTGLSAAERAFYDGLQRRGVIIATTFPSGDQVSSPSVTRDSIPEIAVQRMLPAHARILMMLALAVTQDLRELQRIFNQY
jgi:L-asparaginase/Glu-tRNA(Gln) amidotransferase subunit D